MKKMITGILPVLFVLLLLSGCSMKKDRGTPYQIYYLNIEGTSVETETCYIDSSITEKDQLTEVLLEKLQEEPENAKLRRTLTEDIQNPEVTFNSFYITLNFPAAYGELKDTEEILIRSAVVLTMTQIDGVDSVAFQVDGQALRYRNGEQTVIGRMSADNFLQNPGQQINTSLEDTVTLYFSDPEGTGLVTEKRTIHYSSNESLEKMVMKLLIDGPQTAKAQATLPANTNIINVTVADGICYVNLDDTFRNDQNADIQEQVVLYSIVDSLTEMDGVEKVQLSVNGDSSGKVRYIYSLSEMYEKDLTLLDQTEDSTESAGNTERAATAAEGNK